MSRALLDRIESRLGGAVTRRDLAETPLPQVTETWTAATFTDPGDRTPEQRAALEQSDGLVAELQAADTILIGLPIYNFAPPAALKAWIDLVARRGVTFEYTANGPKGLLEDKRVIVAVASGGTEAGSPMDFATPYLRHVLAFMGLTDVTFVAADRVMADRDAAMERAADQIEAIPA